MQMESSINRGKTNKFLIKLCCPGLYFYNNDVIKISKQIEMSE